MMDSVNSYPISQIFDIESRSVYAVPRYQREYSCGRNTSHISVNGEAFFVETAQNRRSGRSHS